MCCQVVYRGSLSMVSGVSERGEPRRRQRYALLGPETLEYFAAEETMVHPVHLAHRPASLPLAHPLCPTTTSFLLLSASSRRAVHRWAACC